MTMQTEIPEDVMKAAAEAHAEFAKSSVCDNLTTIIARAIMAERERKIAVKPLDWKEITSPREDGPAEPTGELEASCGFGEYGICIDEDEAMAETPWCVWSPDHNIGHYSSLFGGKSAAQADYETRVRSALLEAAL